VFLSPPSSEQKDSAGSGSSSSTNIKGSKVVQPTTSDNGNDNDERIRLDNATLLIPRLISVAEVIKREYLKTLPADQTEGLFQYNELGCLEELPGYHDDGADDNGTLKGDALAAALEGKN
jgi:hypothetical protein